MASKFKSSYTDTSSGKIDADAWVTSKDNRLSLQGWVHDGRWVEMILWDGDAPKASRFVITIYDRHTGNTATARDAHKTVAEQQAKANIGMPIPVTAP